MAMELITQLTVDTNSPNLWQFYSGVLRRKGKIYVGSNGPRMHQLIQTFHDSNLGGRSGQLGTFKRLSLLFYWPTMKQMVVQFVSECEVCHRNKDENAPYLCLLQPVPIPDQSWRQISLDFIEGLPKSSGKDVIFVVLIGSLKVLIL